MTRVGLARKLSRGFVKMQAFGRSGFLSMAHSWKVEEDDFTPEQLG